MNAELDQVMSEFALASHHLELALLEPVDEKEVNVRRAQLRTVIQRIRTVQNALKKQEGLSNA